MCVPIIIIIIIFELTGACWGLTVGTLLPLWKEAGGIRWVPAAAPGGPTATLLPLPADPGLHPAPSQNAPSSRPPACCPVVSSLPTLLPPSSTSTTTSADPHLAISPPHWVLGLRALIYLQRSSDPHPGFLPAGSSFPPSPPSFPSPCFYNQTPRISSVPYDSNRSTSAQNPPLLHPPPSANGKLFFQSLGPKSLEPNRVTSSPPKGPLPKTIMSGEVHIEGDTDTQSRTGTLQEFAQKQQLTPPQKREPRGGRDCPPTPGPCAQSCSQNVP